MLAKVRVLEFDESEDYNDFYIIDWLIRRWSFIPNYFNILSEMRPKIGFRSLIAMENEMRIIF